MAKRRTAPPFDRLAIEAALPPDVRTALDTMVAMYGVPRERWPNVPALAQILQTIAVENVARRHGGNRNARHRAAESLGVDIETHDSRMDRAWMAAWAPERAKCTLPPARDAA